MTIIAIISAREGSKGIQGKNIKSMSSKPLIAHSILDALKAQHVDRIYVTTNDVEIAQVLMKIY